MTVKPKRLADALKRLPHLKDYTPVTITFKHKGRPTVIDCKSRDIATFDHAIDVAYTVGSTVKEYNILHKDLYAIKIHDGKKVSKMKPVDKLEVLKKRLKAELKTTPSEGEYITIKKVIKYIDKIKKGEKP